MSGKYDGYGGSSAEGASSLSAVDGSVSTNRKVENRATDNDGLATSDDDEQYSEIVKAMTASALSIGGSETNQKKAPENFGLAISEDDKHYAEILRAMTCVKCEKLMEPPVYESIASEKICSGCYGNFKCDMASCKSCNPPPPEREYVSEGDVRDTARAVTDQPPCPEHKKFYTISLHCESLSELIFYPCWNLGCDATVKLADQVEHEGYCKMRTILCAQCSWQWALYSFRDHVTSKHASSVISRAQSAQGVPFAVHKMTGTKSQQYFQIYNEKLFRINCHRLGDSYSFWVQSYLAPVDAKPYRFAFQLESNGWTIRKEGLVVSDLEGIPDDCMVIEKSLLNKIGLDKSIRVKFEITKVSCDTEAQGK